MTRGPVYDNAARLLARLDLVTLCHWLGVDAPPESVAVSEALPAATLYADLLVRAAPGRLAHVEFVRSPTRDLPDRMFEYRARILRRHPGVPCDQHVLVLAEGTVPDRLTDGAPALSVTVTYLRDQDPDRFLQQPALAPLAALARPSTGRPRTALLHQALVRIGSVPDPVRRHHLAEVAAVLAGIHLDTTTIEEIIREARMSFTLEDTVAGRAIAAKAEARGEARGRALGEADAQAAMLAALLERRFGPDERIPRLAARLALLPQGRALDAALSAASLDAVLPA